LELDHRTFRMAVERSLGSEFIFSILFKALASVDLGPENARLPLTLFTTKRCPHRDRKRALGTDKTTSALRCWKICALQRAIPLYRNPLLCVSAHLSVLSVLCLYIAYSLAAYRPVHARPFSHLSTHPPI